MSIEGVENLTGDGDDSENIQSDGTEIVTEDGDAEDDSTVTENPGNPPEETEQSDDDSQSVEAIPANPNTDVQPGESVPVDVVPGEPADDSSDA